MNINYEDFKKSLEREYANIKVKSLEVKESFVEKNMEVVFNIKGICSEFHIRINLNIYYSIEAINTVINEELRKRILSYYDMK